MIRITILTWLAVALMIPASAAADISGTWDFAVDTSSGSGNPTFTFRQDGEKLTGTYKGVLGEAPLTGTVKGDEIRFTIEADYAGQKLKLEYSGKILSPASMKGTARYGDLGEATWTAAKK